jgi:phage shock protein PspC (stress-responsive transcriptional regulator)
MQNEKTKNNKLVRDLTRGNIGGVCAGISNYFGSDVTLIRLLFIISFFIPSVPIILIYVILWVITPEKY